MHGVCDEELEDMMDGPTCPLIYPTASEAASLNAFMQRTYPDRYESQRLYHYTTPEVVEKLFADEADLWLSHIGRLNDNLEWVGGLEYVDKYLRKRGRDNLADDYVLLREGKGCVPYVLSMSQYKDKASMWGMYGDRKLGGYAVGFDRADLEQLVEIKNRESKDEYYLLPCLYKEEDVDKLLEHILDEAHVDEDEHLCREGCDDEIPARIISRLFFVSLIIKDGSFDYENEWRLAVRTNDVKPVGWDGLAVPEFEKPHMNSRLLKKTLREYFREVVVSPCGPNWMREVNHSRLEKWRDKYSLEFEVCDSSSPYNGR
jgi:hypothetical protein